MFLIIKKALILEEQWRGREAGKKKCTCRRKGR